jgi:acetyl esterase/lipase
MNFSNDPNRITKGPSIMRCFKIFLPLILLASLPLACHAEEAGKGVRRTEDVIYGRKCGMALTMDVFQPAKPNGAAVIFLVNGGWLSSKSTPMMEAVVPDRYSPFLDRGYTVFAVITSSQPTFTIPDLMDDVLRSVRFIRHNAAKYGVDPNRLGVTGASSGGHLSLTIATRGGPGKPDAVDPVDRESSEVQAVACFFPPTDFLNYGEPGVDGVGIGPLEPIRAAFGPRSYTESGRRTLGKEISPIYYVTEKLPPTLIVHGDADNVVPLQQSESFLKRAKECGMTDTKLVVRPGKGHGWGDYWKSTEDTDEFVKWFDGHLK